MNDELLDNDIDDIEEDNNIVENAEEKTENYDISLSAVYDDYYYNQILNKLDNIQTNQNSSLFNQTQLIEKEDLVVGILQYHSSYFIAIHFTICLIFIISVLRNMLKKV